LAGLEIAKEMPIEPSILRDDIQTPLWDGITGFVIASAEATGASKSKEIKRSVCGIKVLFTKRECLSMREINGDQSLLSVTPNHFLVGLKTCTTEDGLVAKLALLEQPLIRLSTPALYRFDDHRNIATLGYGQVAN
jgi:hypothetical protein